MNEKTLESVRNSIKNGLRGLDAWIKLLQLNHSANFSIDFKIIN